MTTPTLDAIEAWLNDQQYEPDGHGKDPVAAVECWQCKSLWQYHTDDCPVPIVSRLLAIARAAEQKPAKRCDWTEDEDGNWDATCGGKFVLNTGTPRENSFKYCAYCGGALRQRLRGE